DIPARSANASWLNPCRRRSSRNRLIRIASVSPATRQAFAFALYPNTSLLVVLRNARKLGVLKEAYDNCSSVRLCWIARQRGKLRQSERLMVRQQGARRSQNRFIGRVISDDCDKRQD